MRLALLIFVALALIAAVFTDAAALARRKRQSQVATPQGGSNSGLLGIGSNGGVLGTGLLG